METYLEFNGWHFSKKMCQWATSKMYKTSNNQKEYVQPYSLEELRQLQVSTGVTFDLSYDAIYLACVAKADFLGSSIVDDKHLLLYVKDVLDDPDAYEGLPFTRFYADCIGKGTSIPWEDLI